MNTRRHNNPAAQIVIGIAVILVGLLFLLENMGWIDLDLRLQFWPVILIVAGALKFSQSQHGRGRGLGLFLMLFGGVALLQGMGVLYLGWNVLAPVAIIGVGLLVVYRSVRRQRGAVDDSHAAGDFSNAAPGKVSLDKGVFGSRAAGNEENTVYATAILGSFKRRMTSQRFAGGDLTSIMGGCELDLREASIEGSAVLNAFALMGGIEIQVPTDWTVEVEGVPILGGFEETTLRPKDASKRLIIRGYAIMGGLSIRN